MCDGPTATTATVTKDELLKMHKDMFIIRRMEITSDTEYKVKSHVVSFLQPAVVFALEFVCVPVALPRRSAASVASATCTMARYDEPLCGLCCCGEALAVSCAGPLAPTIACLCCPVWRRRLLLLAWRLH